MITKNNEITNREAIEVANRGNPIQIINFFKESHDSITEKTRLYMMLRMLNSSPKTNMLINGCYECLGSTEACFIILHILKEFDEDTLYMVKMPVHVYSHIMSLIVSSPLASLFIEKLIELDLVDRFHYKFRNYLAQDEPINHELRELVIANGFKKALKSLLNTLPVRRISYSSTDDDWQDLIDIFR
jgi:hypothetical protein